ncbi:alginate export family protein [Sphingomonas sp. Y38-1Y]|uniref:alginate export family protein n=1 Tax=Sphingomonas sp. Y38-1Y TaxID=3078265 RepID=UPI0028E81E35|nr:alginate export family protein [Sphingomonas sp. Y38-1Y]
MKHLLAAAAGLLAAAPLCAQDIKPAIEARLRYEHVDQDGLPRPADAVTLRVRPSLTAEHGRWSALVEGEAVVALVDRYNDGLNSRGGYPTIVDPENLELNRAQLRYAAPGTAATLGRQRVALADERFVGTAPWRQSEQTFDAARVQLGKEAGLRLDLSYARAVWTVYGRNGEGARPTSIGGDNLFALASIGGPRMTLSGFAYLVDQNAAPVQGFRLSSQTYGARVAGKLPVGADLSLSYAATLARQSDHHRNPNDYAATYWLAEATLTRGGWSLGGGREVLGADDGTPLTSVQAPLSSAFKFNGWAGKFTTTPPDGLRDLYATLGHGWKAAGPFDAIALSAAWHRFDSDRLVRPYGEELDLLATVKRGRTLVSARWAHYRADGFATDTDKLWLQVDWSRLSCDRNRVRRVNHKAGSPCQSGRMALTLRHWLILALIPVGLYLALFDPVTLDPTRVGWLIRGTDNGENALGLHAFLNDPAGG